MRLARFRLRFLHGRSAAVTEPLSQEGCLETFLEDEADIGGEAGGKLCHTILADFNSDNFMSVVRVSALICHMRYASHTIFLKGE